ncbi:cytochrome P450 [Fomitiporia mediterranea MF3/22]|uniref:cytochrome P450 n=1 Tax=Fomitiporia mediterranea (strain MF3/22) TaxID=694068 RepID=UPI000440834F|nr:cytochrome P450 [Fomitiporia mediterranea MF3/22]EJD01989.1 cytochrome P450 [Fomitiporia mediterranea MF3/22]
MDYYKPSQSRYFLSRLLGNGILVMEGEKHRQQRRIKNPAFSPAPIKDLVPLFFQKALELRDIWLSQIAAKGIEGSLKIEVLSWVSRATLDIIGLAGFHYRFDSLNERQEPDALNKAFEVLLRGDDDSRFLRILQASIPIIRSIPNRRVTQVREAHNTMHWIGERLLKDRQAGGTLEKGRDLLSVLLRANMDTELPDSQRMTDEDVLAQVPTFLVAGHETTSNALAFALFSVAQRPDLQSRLRSEVRGIPTDSPSADDLSSEKLPFLEAVVRETLRVHATVSSIVRVAMKDDVIPFSEPFADLKGRVCKEIRIRKGDRIVLPVLALNRDKSIWGEDADEFNPDRWTNPPQAARNVPGVWGDLLTFGGGSHSCIGYRFAVYEMKAILYTLIRRFEFSLAVPAESIELRSLAITRPFVHGEKGAQMPLMVKVCDS